MFGKNRKFKYYLGLLMALVVISCFGTQQAMGCYVDDVVLYLGSTWERAHTYHDYYRDTDMYTEINSTVHFCASAGDVSIPEEDHNLKFDFDFDDGGSATVFDVINNVTDDHADSSHQYTVLGVYRPDVEGYLDGSHDHDRWGVDHVHVNVICENPIVESYPVSFRYNNQDYSEDVEHDYYWDSTNDAGNANCWDTCYTTDGNRFTHSHPPVLIPFSVIIDQVTVIVNADLINDRYDNYYSVVRGGGYFRSGDVNFGQDCTGYACGYSSNAHPGRQKILDDDYTEDATNPVIATDPYGVSGGHTIKILSMYSANKVKETQEKYRESAIYYKLWPSSPGKYINTNQLYKLDN